MPSGHDGDEELFARAWEQSDATGRPAHHDDPDLARTLDVAAALRAAGRATPGPDPDTRARMRAAVLAEITGGGQPGGREGAAGGAAREQARVPGSGPAGGRGVGRAGEGNRRRERTRPAERRPVSRRRSARPASRRGGARLLSNVLTGACAILLLGALTVLLSHGALPGEMLYGVKRASESVELGLTSGQEAQGLKHLEFAATRLEEVSDLIDRHGTTAAGAGPVAAGLDPDEAALVLANLRAFDEQARIGSRLILPLTAQPSGPSPAELADWARSQSARLDSLRPSLDTEGRTAAAGSQQMLQRLSARAAALQGPESSCPTGSTSDDLGPLPAQGCDARPDQATAPSTSELPSSTTSTTSTTTTTTTTTTSTTTPQESSTRELDGSVSSSRSTEQRTSTPAPVQVPLPVPMLPQVDLPPLLPGMPGLSLG